MTEAGRSGPKRPALVVPCFDEARRLDRARFVAWARSGPFRLHMVNDGSGDETGEVLDALAAEADGDLTVQHLPRNEGKGEAVRQGLLTLLADGAAVVGYVDADLSTPPAELDRLLEQLEATGVQVVLGSRVLLLGRTIERKAYRHYLGRVFATCASVILDLPVYDTQCGAKLFRDSPALRAALEAPFLSRWAFDVELIGRLLSGPSPLTRGDLLEVPLREWRDVAGSKLSVGGIAKSALDVARIGWDLRRR